MKYPYSNDLDSFLLLLQHQQVPPSGLERIQIAREAEYSHVYQLIEDSGETQFNFRFIVGPEGYGKTFFLNSIQNRLYKNNYIVTHLSFNGNLGHLHHHLNRNISTPGRQQNSSLIGVIEAYISTVIERAQNDINVAELTILNDLKQLEKQPGGKALQQSIVCYLRAALSSDELLKIAVNRWLHAQYTHSSIARKELGISLLINDLPLYDWLSLLSGLFQIIGYAGLVVELDDLDKVIIRHAREDIDRYFNIISNLIDGCANKHNPSFYILVSATPELLTNPTVGYFANAERERIFSERRNLHTQAILNLTAFNVADIHTLLIKLVILVFGQSQQQANIPQEAIQGFMERCALRYGQDYYLRPRAPLADFVKYLLALEKHPKVIWTTVLASIMSE